MNLLLLYRIKCLPENTNGRLAIPALAGLLVHFRRNTRRQTDIGLQCCRYLSDKVVLDCRLQHPQIEQRVDSEHKKSSDEL